MVRNEKILKYLSVALGLFLIVSGCLILFLPNLAGMLYDIEDIESLNGPMALGMGIRQFTIGILVIALVVSNQLKALGYVLIISAFIPLGDFIIFGSSVGWISSLRHLISVPFIVLLGISMNSTKN